jgi:hypothetical protein
MGDRLPRFSKDIFLPVQKLVSEILELPLIHEWFVFRRTILCDKDLQGRRLHGRLAERFVSDAPDGARALIANATGRAIRDEHGYAQLRH